MPASSSAHSHADSHAMLRFIVDTATGMVAYFEARTQVCRFASPAFAGCYGLRAGEVLGLPAWEIIGPDRWQAMAPHVERCRSGEPVCFVRQERSPQGLLRDLEVRLTPHLAQGQLLGTVVALRALDLEPPAQPPLRDSAAPRHRLSDTLPAAEQSARHGTQASRPDDLQLPAQNPMRCLAEHDALTRLPNRWLLIAQLEQLIASAGGGHRPAAVLSLDLKHFSTINDSLGQQAGDQVLSEVARRLCSCARSGDLVARAGSDEFIIVLAGGLTRAQVEGRTRQLVAVLEMPCLVAAQQLVIAPAIGIALFPEDGENVEALLRNASAVRNLAKDNGPEPFAFYTPALESRAGRQLDQEQLLRQSIALGGFELHYQPQVRTDTGALAGFEALVRWRHPERGLVSPEEFVALAEARGLITAIDRWVLRQACREACAWHAQGMPRLPVAVNMSAQEFRHPDLASDVAAALAETGLAPQLLHIELTESTLMHSDAQVLRTLHALKALGVEMAIDDFGTGYSSLAYLKRHPIHQLKIDRSFITDVTANDDDAAIVTAIVQLAKSLRLRTVAEGVESAAQFARLRAIGCDMAQGFHIAAPMPAAQALQWQKDYCHKLQAQ